jgi:hypothetical protein
VDPQNLLLCRSQAEVAAQAQGLSLVGYYHGDYKFAPAELSPLGRKIADRIADRQPAACVLLLDNIQLASFTGAAAAAAAAAGGAGGGSNSGGGGGGGGGGAVAAGGGQPLELLLREPSAKGAAWRRVQQQAGGGGLAAGGGGWGAVQKRYLILFAAGRHRALADFDDHLDDLSRDYLNEGLLDGSELLTR